MSVDVLLLFPHQLFASNKSLARGKHVLLVEDPLYFSQYSFHKQKLILHRASMRMHAAFLEKAGVAVHYLDLDQAPTMAAVIERARQWHPERVHLIDPVDDWLERRVLRELKKAGLKLIRHDTPMFLNSALDIEEYFEGRRMFMASFYAEQRKRLDILMKDGRPVGGKWSFDTENRKKLPRGFEPEPLWQPRENEFVREATEYVQAKFPNNPGSVTSFKYPVTYRDARHWLQEFVETRLPQFGAYQDAISTQDSALFHSVLTPMLNIGLLTPREVLDAALSANNIPMNSLEGFVRQIIGWREYVRAAYILQGRRQRTRNYWKHDRPLPAAFWEASTGIDPIDTVIGRVLEHAYAHHIERLMVLGNFMQLCGFRPDDVYRWFMELFIDAYDWVMVPNVYGMALYADGGLISTKPYVAGSNYLRKMSDFKAGPWCDTWDGLFWAFIDRHRRFFEANPRIGPLVSHLDRMAPEKYQQHLARAREFTEGLARRGGSA
ncbi:cryptochrome/photolyase family protein [Steroidobacter sp.]|uniref:cryptochrome/photolyase family protein n=1 Tax=Steroidobacter sp. TaxID=1978227 RepID=UPI001A63B578|nr:cryptochrome/photolyase family protein [Steroidobacter sp.]MBL8268887.1 cryptochrome/photolyase family protein [Steroidobacter sp.]